MSRFASARPLLGNLAVMLLLAAIAVLLLQLQLDKPWWLAAPLPAHWQWAGGSVLLYAGLCTALWWNGRTRDDPASIDGERVVLVTWASQTGFAQQLAERTTEALRAAGIAVKLRPLDKVDCALLAASDRMLLVASTTGEGDPPDHALTFLNRVMREKPALSHLHYAVLALGDRSYTQFCAFGHQLGDWLRQQGAHPLFDTVEVDNADPASLRHWQQLLGQLGGRANELPDWSAPEYQRWALRGRERLNPGSVGGAVFHLRLHPLDAALPHWQAGDIAEIGPQHAPAHVAHWLRAHAVDGDTELPDGQTLRQLLASSHLPDPDTFDSRDPQSLAAALKPLPHREYSIASTTAEGELHLLLRRQLRADGTPGLGSGWLCDHAADNATISLRLRSNSNFHPPAAEAPLILIGNGTGIAGLRAHLQSRIEAGASRNWLLFGERNAAHDFHFGSELRQWQQQGWLERMDVVFSRDGGTHRYVQDALDAARDELQRWVAEGACILVCGSLQGMAPAVDAVIERALGREGKEALLMSGRYRRDVY